MNRHAVALMTAATLIVAGCSKKPETTAVDGNTASAASNSVEAIPLTETAEAAAGMGAQGFVDTVAASDAFEIASSKLAASNGAAAGVKKFAAQMVTAHTESTAKLKAASAAIPSPITPDPTLNADQQAKLDALKTKMGGDFDKEYVADQVTAHEQALQLLQSYSFSGEVPELKQLAMGLAPKVAGHLNMAKGLNP
jgi:putative membrane protein